MQKFLTPLSIIIAAVLIGVANLYASGKFSISIVRKPLGLISAKASPVPSVSPVPSQPPAVAPIVEIPTGTSPSLGESSAPVTVVEFSDFQCPFCAAVAGVENEVYRQIISANPGWQSIFPSLKNDYIDKGLVKFVYKDFAFLGVESEAAANAALCAGDQGEYWAYHDLLFKNQKGENEGAFSKENLEGLAESLDLEMTEFGACLSGEKYFTEIDESASTARRAGVTGTPTFFVNGKIVPGGAIPYSVLKEAIENELKR